MAVAIKMDELLVSWLGNDSMYENVLNSIENAAAQQQQTPDIKNAAGSPNPAIVVLGVNTSINNNDNSADITTTATETTKDSSVGSGGGGGLDGLDSGIADVDNSDCQSYSSIGSSSIIGINIPTFYYPPIPVETNSTSAVATAQRLRRRRRTPIRQFDTWLPLPEAELQEQKPKQPQEETKDNQQPTGGDGTPDTPPGSTIAAANNIAATDGQNNNNDLSQICVRDQVRAIYVELGHDPPLTSPTSVESNSAAGVGVGISGVDNENNNESVIASMENNDDDKTNSLLKRKYLTVENFVRVTKEVCKFPSFFNVPFFERILELWNAKETQRDSKISEMDVITYEMFEWYWLSQMEPYDAHERFFRLTKSPSRNYIIRDDFLPFIKALLNDHPGLEFLSNHMEFQEKYAMTVITRIFYCVDRCHSGKITSRQIRRSDLLETFNLVDEEEDINKVTKYFSYEHFYVLYCRFWELDHDRDYKITREDLLKYGDHSLSHMIVDRIFDAAPRPFFNNNNNSNKNENNPSTDPATNNNTNASPTVNREYLSYEDFIYFMLSEEDKANEVSVRYWFTCVDVDGDGKLNNMEMRSFYAVQLHRMQLMGHEIVPFEDMLCQMMDMIKPKNTDFLVVEDFLQTECSQVSGALFDALFNLNKYLLFEQRDPFVERQKREDEFDTDWDRFACIDYNRLAMEEEAREEEAMEIDWVTVDEDEDNEDFSAGGANAAGAANQQQQQQYQYQQQQLQGGDNGMQADGAAAGLGGVGVGASEAPF